MVELEAMDAVAVIKEKILESARETAERILSAANESCAAKKAAAEAEADKAVKGARAEAERQAAEILSQAKISAALEGRKALLKAKRGLIERVFVRALESLYTADRDYTGFVSGLVAKYAENGDEVLVCAADKDRLNAEWLNRTARKIGLTLKLSKEYHTDRGGVVLRGAVCDKRLTLDALFSEAAGRAEELAVEILFGKDGQGL